MPCWYYDKKELRDTPSILDGISFETERRYRKEGARFIINCGRQMGLGHNTWATGVVYFHRFYMFHSFKSFPRYVTACCCLFLAGKVEETPKKCRDIIKYTRELLSDNHFFSFGEDPKEEVMTLERILLQTIKFDLQVEHPYTFLLKYAKGFKGDQQKLQKMVQMAWNFVNDSLSTVVCLQWEPEIIAVALIHLASKLSKFTLVDWVGRQSSHGRWWDMFVSDVTMEIIEDICHQVLDLYQANQKDAAETNSPPQKPPSRADSPTAVKGLPLPTITGSPTAKAKPITSVLSGTPTANSAITTTTEVNNIQSIKSLANSIPVVLQPTTVEAIPVTTAVQPINTSAYHMYHAPPPHALPPPHAPPPVNPHQMHSIYGTAPVTVAPPPPQPPIAPPNYSIVPPTNTWPPQASHYGTVPPPPPPGGYYPPPPPANYGRQQQQQQQQPRYQ